MSNSRAEGMVRTIKRGIACVFVECGDSWDNATSKVVFGCCRRTVRVRPSPFQLSYGVKPRIVKKDGLGAILSDFSVSKMEIVAVGQLRAEKVSTQKEKVARMPPTTKLFKKEDLVLVAHGLALGIVKWPVLNPSFTARLKW